MPIELVFVIGIAVLLLLCLKFKTNAFIALIVTALIMGVLSGMSGVDTISTICSGFAGTVEDIGIVIIFGILLGNYLDAAHATNRMAMDAVHLVGQKRADLAMSITGYLVSIPVFCDAAMVILTPLVKAIHRKTKIPLGVLGVSLAAGLLSTHVYVPPTPGPLAAAGLLGIDIGQAILYGAFAAVFMTAGGFLFAHFYLAKKKDSYYQFQDGVLEAENKEEAEESTEKEEDLPGSLRSLLPLMIPLLLIVGNTVCSMVFPKKSTIVAVTSFIGNANVALALGAALALLLLGKRLGAKKVHEVMNNSLKDAGPIVFITASGGALGAILKASGAGASLADMVVNTKIPFILIPFVISGLLKVVQGSGTVAVTTAATLCAPIASQLGLNPILIFLASGAGARACCHVNDSFFWVFTNCMGFDMKTGLKTLSLSNIFMALGGLAATFICSLWL